MRKLLYVLAWAALIALIATWPFLTETLPVTNEDAAARISGGWSGVLRLWVCDEMWTPGGGSFVPWLNACISRFERRNPGVYVQVSSVPLAVLRAFDGGDFNPPDMLLLAPGMLSGGNSLLAFSPDAAIPENLRYAGEGYAAAVALGGYGWALNRSYLSEVPVDWTALGEGPKSKKGQRAFAWVDAPADRPFVSYTYAFLSLITGREISEETREPAKAGEGLNLGLEPADDATPAPTPRQTKRINATLPSSLPADFRTRESVLSDFVSGRTAAVLASLRDMGRLEALSGAGRAPDWTLEPAPSTDQVAFLAVADLPRQDLAARQALSKKLVEHLLSDESQKALSKVRAFRVLPGEAMYASRTGFSQLERALNGGVRVPSVFDAAFRAEAERAADDLITRGGGT